MRQNLTVLGSHPNFNTCSWKEMVGLDGPGAQFRPLAQNVIKLCLEFHGNLVMFQNQLFPEVSFSQRLTISLKFDAIF